MPIPLLSSQRPLWSGCAWLLLLLGLARAGWAQGSTAAGSALAFNGEDTYLAWGAGPRGISQQLTVEGWVKCSSLAEQLLVSHLLDSAGVKSGFALGLDQGRARIFRPGSPGQLIGSGLSTTLVADGRWHHLAGEVDGQHWRLYVDGELSAEATVSSAPGTLQAHAPLLLGAGLDGIRPVQPYEGQLDELRLWNVARPLDSLRANMCRKLPGLSKGRQIAELVGSCDFENLDQGSLPAPSTLYNASNGSWWTSGAPIGTAGRYYYGLIGPGGARPALGNPRTDSVIVIAVAAGVRGVHLYANGSVYGIFTVGLPAQPRILPPDAAFTLRYRPGGGLSCNDLLRRPTCLQAWAPTGARLTPDRQALHLPVQQDRGEVQLISTPPFTAFVTGDDVLCAGSRATLQAVAPANSRFRWSTGDTTATIFAPGPGHYSVSISSDKGCPPQRREWDVRLGPSPAPPFRLGADTTICLGTALTLEGPAGPGLQYEWADGSRQRSRVVREAGTYELSVRAACGPVQRASIRLAMQDCFRVPTVITPDGDGRNDRFAIQENTPGTWQLALFSRWGSQVFQADDYHHDWGAGAAPGLYYVLLRRTGTDYTYRGWLEVIR